jgi:hypothetical protein
MRALIASRDFWRKLGVESEDPEENFQQSWTRAAYRNSRSFGPWNRPWNDGARGMMEHVNINRFF